MREDDGGWEDFNDDTEGPISIGFLVIVTPVFSIICGATTCIDVRSEVLEIILGWVGDIAVEDIDDSAKEDSGEAIPNIVRLVEDILHAALSTMHCWQLELKLFGGLVVDPLMPLFVSLSHS